MKITLNRAAFLEELIFVDTLIAKNSLNDIYKLIHCFNEKGVLTFVTSDNGLAFAKAIMVTDIDEIFSFAIVPDKLISVLKTFTSETFNISLDGTKAIVSSGKSKYTFKTQPVTPIFVESLDKEDSTNCNYTFFKKAIDIASSFTKQKESTQYTLTLFEMNLTPDAIKIRSTDGNKMVHSSLEDPVEGRNLSLNIDSDYVHVLNKLNRAERIEIEKYQTNIIFISDNRKVKINRKIGNLPNTDSIINKCLQNNNKNHIVKRDMMIEPLKRISAILDGQIKKVTLLFEKNIIKLISDEHEEEIDSTGDDNGSFTLSGMHLMDVLRNSGNSMKFNFSTENDFAIYITDDENNQFMLGKTV